MQISIYQLVEPYASQYYKQSYDAIVSDIDSRLPKHFYKKIYSGIVDDSCDIDKIYAIANNELPSDFVGHTLTVSDVVGIDTDGEILKSGTFYFCDNIGWVANPFAKQEENTNESFDKNYDGLNKFYHRKKKDIGAIIKWRKLEGLNEDAFACELNTSDITDAGLPNHNMHKTHASFICKYIDYYWVIHYKNGPDNYSLEIASPQGGKPITLSDNSRHEAAIRPWLEINYDFEADNIKIGDRIMVQKGKTFAEYIYIGNNRILYNDSAIYAHLWIFAEQSEIDDAIYGVIKHSGIDDRDIKKYSISHLPKIEDEDDIEEGI